MTWVKGRPCSNSLQVSQYLPATVQNDQKMSVHSKLQLEFKYCSRSKLMLGISGFNNIHVSATIILWFCGAPSLRDADNLEKFVKFEQESLLWLNPGIHYCLSFFSPFFNPH